VFIAHPHMYMRMCPYKHMQAHTPTNIQDTRPQHASKPRSEQRAAFDGMRCVPESYLASEALQRLWSLPEPHSEADISPSEAEAASKGVSCADAVVERELASLSRLSSVVSGSKKCSEKACQPYEVSG